MQCLQQRYLRTVPPPEASMPSAHSNVAAQQLSTLLPPLCRQQLQDSRSQVASLQLEVARLQEGLQAQDLQVHRAQLSASEEQSRAGSVRAELAALAASHAKEVESKNRWAGRWRL